MTSERKEALKQEILLAQLKDLPIVTENHKMVNKYFIGEVSNLNWKNINITVNSRLDKKLSYAYYRMVLVIINTIDMSFFEWHLDSLKNN